MEDNTSGNIQPRRYYRYSDALEMKPHFILGVPIETLAEELAMKRGTEVSQALRYLEYIRGRDGWIDQRNQQLLATSSLAEQRTMQDRAKAIAMTQAEVADRLVQIGLEEITTTKSANRSEALRTLEMGYRFAYRSNNLPDHVIDPSLIPDTKGVSGNRAAELQGMSKEEAYLLVQRLVGGPYELADSAQREQEEQQGEEE